MSAHSLTGELSGGAVHRQQDAQSTARLVAGAFAIGVLCGVVLARRLALGTVGGLLVGELARRGANRLAARTDRST